MLIGKKDKGSNAGWSTKRKKKRRYGQVPLKHAKKGIDSCVYAGLTLLILVLAVCIAYLTRGTSAVYIGIMGLLAMVSAGRGIYDAVKGFKEREKNYLTCKVGIGCNSLFLLCLIFIYVGGLF